MSGLNDDQLEDEAQVEADMMGSVTPIRRLQPGDVLDVVIKLRQLLAQVETCAFTLYASFDELGGGPELGREAEKTRHTLELATTRMASLLTSIEKTSAYVELRRETLARRKNRSSKSKRD